MLKFMAAMAIAWGIAQHILITISAIWFSEATTAAERIQGRLDAWIIFLLGGILWTLASKDAN